MTTHTETAIHELASEVCNKLHTLIAEHGQEKADALLMQSTEWIDWSVFCRILHEKGLTSSDLTGAWSAWAR